MGYRSKAEFCRAKKISSQLLTYYLQTLPALEAIKLCEKARDGADRRGNKKGCEMMAVQKKLDIKFAEETRRIKASKVKPGFYVWDAPHVDVGKANYRNEDEKGKVTYL